MYFLQGCRCGKLRYTSIVILLSFVGAEKTSPYFCHFITTEKMCIFFAASMEIIYNWPRIFQIFQAVVNTYDIINYCSIIFTKNHYSKKPNIE
jgi:hypothetical protein